MRSVSFERPAWTRSASMKSGRAYFRDWPSFDGLCVALNEAYRRMRRTHARRLQRHSVPRMLCRSAVVRLPSGLILVDGAQSALTVALLGWCSSWEGRHSIETLTSRGHRDPPFGLLEWLSFAPAQLAVYRQGEWNMAVLHRFVADLKRTWITWCAIAACRQSDGHYVASPSLLPPRALWIGPFDRRKSVSPPEQLSESLNITSR